MSEEIKKALTVKTGQRTSYDIYQIGRASCRERV